MRLCMLIAIMATAMTALKSAVCVRACNPNEDVIADNETKTKPISADASAATQRCNVFMSFSDHALSMTSGIS